MKPTSGSNGGRPAADDQWSQGSWPDGEPAQPVRKVAGRALIVVNPSLPRTGPNFARRIRQAVGRLGWEGASLITQPGSNVEKIAGALARERFDLLIAAGGDGTVAEVMAVGHQTRLPIAIVPRGTANIVARELGLPTGWRQALRHALSRYPRSRRIDLARVNSGYSALASGIGFDAMVMRSTPRTLKYWFGRAAYVLAGAWWLPRTPLFDCRIIADGEDLSTEAVVVVVANAGMLVGGPFRFAPGISLDDGWLDLLVYQPRTASERLGVVWNLLRQRRDGAQTLHRKVRSVEITAPDVMWHEVDGDVYQGNALKVDVLAGGVQVLV